MSDWSWYRVGTNAVEQAHNGHWVLFGGSVPAFPASVVMAGAFGVAWLVVTAFLIARRSRRSAIKSV